LRATKTSSTDFLSPLLSRLSISPVVTTNHSLDRIASEPPNSFESSASDNVENGLSEEKLDNYMVDGTPKTKRSSHISSAGRSTDDCEVFCAFLVQELRRCYVENPGKFKKVKKDLTKFVADLDD